MKYKIFSIIIILFSAALFISCGKSDDKIKTENNQTQIDNSTLVIVEIKTKGMTCTGCEKNIRKEVEKLNGIQEVNADHKTNTTKITFNSGQTNIKSLEDAISAAGYKVIEVKEQKN